MGKWRIWKLGVVSLEIEDFEDSEFYCCRIDIAQKKEKVQTDLQKEVDIDEFTIFDIWGAEEWKEANENWEKRRKNEANKSN